MGSAANTLSDESSLATPIWAAPRAANGVHRLSRDHPAWSSTQVAKLPA